VHRFAVDIYNIVGGTLEIWEYWLPSHGLTFGCSPMKLVKQYSNRRNAEDDRSSVRPLQVDQMVLSVKMTTSEISKITDRIPLVLQKLV
jgi:hypothetical protein